MKNTFFTFTAIATFVGTANAQTYIWEDLDLSSVTQAQWDSIGGGNGGTVTINNVNGVAGLDLSLTQADVFTGTYEPTVTNGYTSTIGGGANRTRLQMTFSGTGFYDALRVNTIGIAIDTIENVRFLGPSASTLNFTQTAGTGTPIVLDGAIDGSSSFATFGFDSGLNNVEGIWDSAEGTFFFHDISIDDSVRTNTYTFQLGTAIPEPSSSALLGLGALVILTRRKR